MKWDCEIIKGGSGAKLRDNRYNIIDNQHSYIGKRIRLMNCDFNISSKDAYWEYEIIDHYCNDKWGYIGNFMFSILPDSEYIDEDIKDDSNPCKIGILEVVLGR